MVQSTAKQKVLICEDDAASLLLLRTILEKRDYEVVGEATTGIEAINLYDREKPDLVLLDINMPKGGGITTLRFMRELDKEPYIVMLTGDSSKFNVETAKKLGANDYILKSSVQKPNFLERLKTWNELSSHEMLYDVAKQEELISEAEDAWMSLLGDGVEQQQPPQKKEEDISNKQETSKEPPPKVHRMVRPETQHRRRHR